MRRNGAQGGTVGVPSAIRHGGSRAVFLAVALTLLAATPARAIVELDASFSVTDADYLALGANANYTAVGFVSGPGTAGTGVLVAPDWVLTAAHIANAQTLGVSTFGVGGNFYTIDSRIIYPGYSASPINNDIALLHLAAPVLGVAPAMLYTGGGELGLTGTWVGFGQTGTGITGQNGTGLGTKRAATNIMDVYGYTSFTPTPDIYLTNNSTLGTFIIADFDDDTAGNNTLVDEGSSRFASSLEGSLAGSDSGGGVFADIGGNTVLVGIGDFIAPGDFGSNTQYGALSGATRVSAYAPWVTANIPEPGMCALGTGILAASAIFFRRGRRQRRV